MSTAVIVGLLVVLMIGALLVVRWRRTADAGVSDGSGELLGAGHGRSGNAVEHDLDTFVIEAREGRDQLVGQVIPAGSSILMGEGPVASEGSKTPVAWNQAVQAVPAVAQALSRGEIVRIIGPSHLVDGLKSGALSHTVTKAGVIGAVKGPDGKFVGHLRFESTKPNPAVIAGPLVVFQLASAVTMQYYLHQMTVRLASIEHGIDDIKGMLHAQTVGKVRTGIETCNSLEPFVDRGVPFSEADRREIEHASQGTREAYHELVENLGSFRSKVEAAIDENGKVRSGAADDVVLALKSGATGASKSATLFLEALGTRMRLLRLRAFAELNSDPTRANILEQSIRSEVETMRCDFEMLRGPFDRLNLRSNELPGLFHGKGEDELAAYRQATKGLRAVVRTPVRRVLSEPPSPQPFMVELMRRDDGEIDSRYALLEAGAS